ncbi:NRDE family protein [Thalassotalea maritima]|uniref:NRDE family protein n=1 Tax=Thalassotalea maritima TaxID=3242416 RepID=UPI003527C73D
MCILFIAIEQHPDYPLIIAANRDEFYQRPTQQAHIWHGPDGIYAGKDNQQGGTWLGINQRGEFAALTNIREQERHRDDATSRGELVVKALAGDINHDWLLAHSDEYNPFNLVYQHQHTLYCYNSIDKTQTMIDEGFHAICNGHMDDVWPKMARGEQALETLVRQAKQQRLNIDKHALLALLKDPEQAPDYLLPDTGVGIDWERTLSSVFIQSSFYGTRSSAIVLKKNDNSFEFFEQSYNSQGSVTETTNVFLNQQGQYEF